MKKRILFLDDDRFSMTPYAEKLQAEGYIVDFYIEPADAYDYFIVRNQDCTRQGQYDLMIVDLMMRLSPDELPEEAEQAGIRFVSEARERYQVFCPVLFLTVLCDEDIVAKAAKFGKVLQKPISIESFMNRVREAIK